MKALKARQNLGRGVSPCVERIMHILNPEGVTDYPNIT